jgi:anti-anti-sigma factor
VSRLNIEHSLIENGTVHLVRPVGKLDVFTFVELKVFLEKISEGDKTAKAVVDMGGAEYVASSGWSVLLGRRKLMRLGGGDLVVFGLSGEVDRVYQSMRVGKVLPKADDLAGALALLKSAPEGGDA